jgi:hypothetical protein
VGLIESIPLNKRASDDLYRWMSQGTFHDYENLFRYHLSDQEYGISLWICRQKAEHAKTEDWSALADGFRTFLLNPDIFELTLSAV